MSTEFANTILILGAAQGLFLALLLATKPQNSAANRILAAAMLAFSVFIFQGVYYARQYFHAFPHLIGVSTPLIYAFGPILYIYARTVSRGGHTIESRSILHFVPFLAVLVYFLPFYVQPGDAKVAFLESVFQSGPPLDLVIVEQIQYPYGLLYAVLTAVLIRRHRVQLRDTHSSFERISLTWLRNLTIGIVAIWALATGLNLANMGGMEIGAMESRITSLAVSILVYCLGYLGLRQSEIFQLTIGNGTGETQRNEAATVYVAPAGEGDGGLPERTGYEKSGLDRDAIEALTNRLLALMEDRALYKEPTLTLSDLAGALSVTPHNLSQVINTQLGKNFYDFVNTYRVEEAKRRLVNPKDAHLTILAIAEESGFNSKSSFNTFFRKHAGMTPSDYRKRQIPNTKYQT